MVTPRGRSYDEFAGEFERDASVGVGNALYDRPTVLAMLGDVRGRRVLDVGCDPVWVSRSRRATANDCASPTVGASLDGRRHRDLARCDRARQHISCARKLARRTSRGRSTGTKPKEIGRPCSNT
jgi:hypothetical protein